MNSLTIENDPRCNAFQRYDQTDKEFLRDYIEKFHGSAFLSTEVEQHYAVCVTPDQIIGDLSVFYTEADRCFTIGITISYKFHRQGYAHEILCGLIARLSEQYPTIDIVALIEKENTPSIQLFKKLGFIEECYAESIQSYIYVYDRTRSPGRLTTV